MRGHGRGARVAEGAQCSCSGHASGRPRGRRTDVSLPCLSPEGRLEGPVLQELGRRHKGGGPSGHGWPPGGAAGKSEALNGMEGGTTRSSRALRTCEGVPRDSRPPQYTLSSTGRVSRGHVRPAGTGSARGAKPTQKPQWALPPLTSQSDPGAPMPPASDPEQRQGLQTGDTRGRPHSANSLQPKHSRISRDQKEGSGLIFHQIEAAFKTLQ